MIKIGVIGCCGIRGRLMSKIWHNPSTGESIVVAGTDIDISGLKEFKKQFGENTFVTADYKELVKKKEIDAVAIMSPDYCHEEHAIAVLKAGKHVFCEKPLAITIEGCDRILAEWKKSKKKLMVGFNMRYMNIFRAMKDIVDRGIIGKIKTVWVRHFVGGGGDWYYHDWHGIRKNTTSLLLQKASHDIDMIHWITGKYTKKVSAFGSLDYYGGNKPNDLTCFDCKEQAECIESQTKLCGQGERTASGCVFRKEIDVEDNNMMIMELEGGIKASYMQCHFTPDYFRNYTFIGTEGRVENLDDHSRLIVLTRDRSKKWKNLTNMEYNVKIPKGSHGGADPVICKDFIDMITKDKESISHPTAGRMSVAVGCAATESLRKGGKVIIIPPLP